MKIPGSWFSTFPVTENVLEMTRNYITINYYFCISCLESRYKSVDQVLKIFKVELTIITDKSEMTR